MISPASLEEIMREEIVLLQLGQKIQAVRNEQKITQEKLAELSELDRTYISSVERGQRNISILNIIKISDALGITACSLLEGLGGHDD